MGMYQGMSTKFMEVPADVVAEVMASTSKMNPLFADPSAAVASAGAIAQMAPMQAGKP
jgi:threonine dehydratase